MKKISFTIISLSFLFWSFQGQATQFGIDGNGSEIELSDSEKEELAVTAVRFLHENRTGVVSTTGLLAIYNAVKVVSINSNISTFSHSLAISTNSFPPSYEMERLAKWAAARNLNLFFTVFLSALTALELLLIPTDLEAATMTDYYLSDEGMEELGNMSDKDLRQTIGFHGLSDGLILELGEQLGNMAEAQDM